jgi:hypothetical protein
MFGCILMRIGKASQHQPTRAWQANVANRSVTGHGPNALGSLLFGPELKNFEVARTSVVIIRSDFSFASIHGRF